MGYNYKCATKQKLRIVKSSPPRVGSKKDFKKACVKQYYTELEAKEEDCHKVAKCRYHINPAHAQHVTSTRRKL